jgi:carbon monoxide dehydrogenase subunit G
MKLTQQVRLPLAPRDAWVALNDVNVLQSCIPGCESLRAVSTDEFELRFTVPVGPIELKFQGGIRLCDVDPASSYTLRFADAAGRSRAEARVRFEEIGQNETLLRYTASIAVRGWIALLGTPLLDTVVRQLADDFFRKFGVRACGSKSRRNA